MPESPFNEHRLVPRGGAGLSCDEQGVALGPIPLVAVSHDVSGRPQYDARPAAEIGDALRLAFGPIPDEIVIRGIAACDRIARLLSDGARARAAIVAVQVGLPKIAAERMAKLAASELCKFIPCRDELGPSQRSDQSSAQAGIRKASSTDLKHPGWPAGTEGGRGGQFRPKDGIATTDLASPEFETTPKTVLALSPFSASDAPEPVDPRQFKGSAPPEPDGSGPGKPPESKPPRRDIGIAFIELLRRMGRIGTASSVPEIERALEPFRGSQDSDQFKAEIDALIKFAHPRAFWELKAIPPGDADETFGTFDAFKKIDLSPELMAKRFGPAGDGWDWHHVVPQGGQNRTNKDIDPEQLQSTTNIVRIPRLLHERISEKYLENKEGTNMTRRQWMETQPFEVQHEEGLKILREVGALK